MTPFEKKLLHRANPRVVRCRMQIEKLALRQRECELNVDHWMKLARLSMNTDERRAYVEASRQRTRMFRDLARRIQRWEAMIQDEHRKAANHPWAEARHGSSIDSTHFTLES